MQGRTMNVQPSELPAPSAHLQQVLGPEAPTYQQLLDSGVLETTTPGAPSRPGDIGVRLKREGDAAVAPPAAEPPPPKTGPKVGETISESDLDAMLDEVGAEAKKPEAPAPPSAPTPVQPERLFTPSGQGLLMEVPRTPKEREAQIAQLRRMDGELAPALDEASAESLRVEKALSKEHKKDPYSEATRKLQDESAQADARTTTTDERLKAIRRRLQTLEENELYEQQGILSPMERERSRLRQQALRKQQADSVPPLSSPNDNPKRRLRQKGTQKAKATAPPRETWTAIGLNAQGAPLFEDANGVRSYMERGVRITEPVNLVPRREGGYSYSVGERGPEFTPTEAPAPSTEKTPAEMIAAAAKLGVTGIDEAVKGIHALFGGGKRTGSGLTFDEKTYAAAKPHFETAWKNFKGAGRELKDFVRYWYGEAGDAIRPYIRRFVLEQQGGTEKPPRTIADWVSMKLQNGEAFDSKELFNKADEAYGGTQAEGKYSVKDAYDSLELGVNFYLRGMSPDVDAATAERTVKGLKELLKKIPTQTKRTAEQDEFQQFSTPPPLAFVAAWVSGVHRGDEVLEPSAGIGGIAVFGLNAGARVVANELSPRRSDILREMGFHRQFAENAEQIHNILPEDVKPTVVLMNPPFSATAGRMKGVKKTEFSTLHIEQALSRLQPGGRLVAIVGEGMGPDRPTFKDWWRSVGQRYNVRANIGVAGEEYAKYGTSFGNQIVVIDKPLPNEVVGLDRPVTGQVTKVEELIPLLEGIRNDRNRDIEPPAAQPGSPEAAGEGQGEAGPGSAARPGTGTVATGPARPERQGSGERPGLGNGSRPGETGAGNDVPGGAGQPGGVGERPGETGQPEGGGRPTAATGGVEGGGGSSVLGQSLSDASYEEAKAKNLESGAIFEDYTPQFTAAGARPHPTPLSESAAMASVKYPAPNYTASIPQESITKGLISAPQLECVMLAGAAHARELPNGDTRGFFVGDGTGVGKGRTISAILWDNWNKGKKKGVWVSADQKLYPQAQADMTGIGWSGDHLIQHRKTGAKEDIEEKQGVLFTTFDLFKTQQRMDQLKKWLGKDFDGVIVFDEAHKMGNALDDDMGGKASRRALAGVELQQAFPKAKVVYSSATGATEIENLAYAHRLGLWGPGTPFADQREFIGKVGSQGLAAMEVLSKDLKAMGLYLSRNLDFRGVNYERLEHPLNPKQKEMYNTLARAWQVVLQNMQEALETTGGSKDRFAKQAAEKAFWGAHQRFFNQVLTSLQMETVKAHIRKSLDAGHSVVLQIVNTMAAATERAIAQASAESGGDVDLESLDITPRDALAQYVKNSWPIYQYEEYVDDNGNQRTRQVQDAAGNPVINRDAVSQRDRLIGQLASIMVPPGALDDIIDTFGVENVAEVTGRTRRVVSANTPEGRKKVIEPRSQKNNLADRAAFDDLKKRILVFSEAGGTGANYHADLKKKNQQQRDHYVIQAGWRADAAIQGLGRTHRSNQAQPPLYLLVSTDVPGHKRFVSTIARRIEQLGALTKAQRETASQGLFKASDNLESSYATEALRGFLQAIDGNQFPDVAKEDFEKQTGIKLRNAQGEYGGGRVKMSQFLNRLLSMNLDMQERVFDRFSKNLDTTIEWHRRNGTLDTGMETLDALHTKKVRDTDLYTDPQTGAKTKLVVLEQEHPTKRLDFQNYWLKKDSDGGEFTFVRNRRSGKLWVLSPEQSRAKTDGTVERSHFATSANFAREYLLAHEVNDERFEFIPNDQARALWEEQKNALPPTYKENVNLVTGTIIPVWDRLPYVGKIARAQEDNGSRHLGVVMADDYVPKLLERFGAESKIEMTPANAVDAVLDKGKALGLSNGWRISSRLVNNQRRIEITGPDYQNHAELEKAGVILEQINWKMRYFIPTGANAEAVMDRITKYRQIVNVSGDGFRELSPAEGKPGDRAVVPGSDIPLDTPADIRRVIDDPKSNVSPEHRTMLRFMLDKGLMDQFPGLRAEVTDFIRGGAMGEYTGGPGQSGFIRFARWSEASTPFHELMHHVWRFLSPEDRAAIGAMRRKMLLSEAPSEHRGDLLKGISSDEFVKRQQAEDSALGRDHYHLANDSEFFAWLMSNKAEKAITTPEAKGIIGKVTNLLKVLRDAFKDAFGLSAKEDALWRKIIGGKYEYRMRDGAKFAKAERELSLPRSTEEADLLRRRREMAVPERITGAYRPLAEVQSTVADHMGYFGHARDLNQMPLNSEMADYGEQLTGAQTYRNLRDSLGTTGEKNEVARSAQELVTRHQFLGLRIQQHLDRALDYIRGDQFRKLLDKQSVAKSRAETADEVRQTFLLQSSASAGRILSQLEALKTTGAMSDQLQDDLRTVQRLPEVSSAIRSRFDDIVNVLTDLLPENVAGGAAITRLQNRPERDRAISLLLEGTPASAQEIYDLYAANLPAERQGGLTGDQAAYTRLACQVLASNAELRNAAASLEMVQRGIISATEYNAAGSKIAQDLIRHPQAAVQRIAKTAARLSDRATRAEAAWLAINRKVTKAVGIANVYSQAMEIHKGVMEDPGWRAHTLEVFADTGQLPIPDDQLATTDPGKVYFRYAGNQDLYGPSGKVYRVELGDSTAPKVQESMEQLTRYKQEVDQWLEENPNHPSAVFWRERQTLVESTLMSQAVWNPVAVNFVSGKLLGAKKTSFGIPEAFFQGLRMSSAKLANLASKGFDRYFTLGQGWVHKLQAPVERDIQHGFQSHRLQDGERQQWREDYLNHIAWNFRNGRDVRAGDVLCGQVVTHQDVAAAKSQGRAFAELYDTAQEGRSLYGAADVLEAPRIFEQFADGSWAVRKPMEIGLHKGTTLPRRESSSGSDLALSVHKLIADRADELGKLPQMATGRTEAEMQSMRDAIDARYHKSMASLLNGDRVFNNFVLGFMEERIAAWAPKASPYEDHYEAITQLHKSGSPDAPRSVADLVNWIARNSTDSPDTVRDTIFGPKGEFTAISERFYKKWEESEANKASGVRATQDLSTAFSRAYSGDDGPAAFYNYGWSNGMEMRSFANDMAAFGLDRLNDSLGALETDMVKSLAVLGNKSEREKSAIKKANRVQYEDEQDFVLLQTLESKLSELRQTREGFKVWNDPMAVQRSQMGLGLPGRLLNLVTKAALTGVRTAGRISGVSMGGSAVKMGLVFQQLGKSRLTSTPEAALRAVISMGKVGTASMFGWYFPEKGFVPGVPMQVAKNLPGAVRAFAGGRGADRVWSALEAALKSTTDDQWAVMRWWGEQKKLGMTPDTPLGAMLAANLNAPRSKGGIYPVKANYPETIFGKMWMRTGDVAYQLLAVSETMVDAAATYFPTGFGYNVNYEAVGSQAGAYIKMLATNARRTFDTYEKLGKLGQFNFDNPVDPRNELKPWEVLPTFWNVFGQDPANMAAWRRPTATYLTFARDLFSSAIDVDLNDLMIRYWKRLSETAPERRGEVQFLAPEVTDPAAAVEKVEARLRGIASRFVEQTHHAVPSNRPWWLQKNRAAQLIYPFGNWTAQTLKLIDTYMGGAATSKWDGKIPLLIAGGMAGVAALCWATAGGDTEVRLLRLLDRYLNHKESTAKTIDEAGPWRSLVSNTPGQQPWTRENTKAAGQILVHDMTAWMPAVNTVFNSLLGESGYRGTSTMQAFSLDKLNSFLTYARGVMATHDPTYGLARLTEANFPFSEPFIENLASRQGFQISRNSVRALQKFGPQDLVEKRQSFGGVSVPTELSPYKNAFEEAVFSGKQDLVSKAAQAFLEKANAMGRPDADKLLGQIYGSLNPDRKAFGVLPTDQQHADALAKMSDWERGQVQQAERNYAAAGNLLGHSSNFVQEDTVKGGGGRSSGGAGGAMGAGGGTSSGGSSRATGAIGGGGLSRMPGGRARLSVAAPRPRGASLGRGRSSGVRRTRLRVGGGGLRAGHRHYAMALPRVKKPRKLRVYA